MEETADEYGRAEGCFQDYQGEPFNFKTCCRLLSTRTEQIEMGRLINEAQKFDIGIPEVELSLGNMDDAAKAQYEAMARLSTDEERLRVAYPRYSRVRERNLYLELPIIEDTQYSDLDELSKEVNAKRNADWKRQWLPLCSFKANRDEAMEFPPYIDRLPILIDMEINKMPKFCTKAGEVAALQRPTATSILPDDYLNEHEMFQNSLEFIKKPILQRTQEKTSPDVSEPTHTIDLTSSASTPASEDTASTIEKSQNAPMINEISSSSMDAIDNMQEEQQCRPTMELRTTSPGPESDDIMSRVAAIMRRKDRQQAPTSQSTANMIDNFLEMRAIQTVPRSNPPPAPALAVQPPTPPPVKREVAPYPPYEVPAAKGIVFVSIKLKPFILESIDRVWEPQHLIDVDYSRACPTSKDYLEEADITISYKTGIIVTNIHQVRQKAPQNSGNKIPLHQRIDAVSTMYDNLTVLVSEENPLGEYVAEASPSDTRAYLEFAKYATKLGGVTCSLVSGSTETLSHWILSLLCKHSAESQRLVGQVPGIDTPMEIYLRRNGMNIAAAKLLARLLSDDGIDSPDALCSVHATERAQRYAALGPKSVSKMMKIA